MFLIACPLGGSSDSSSIDWTSVCGQQQAQKLKRKRTCLTERKIRVFSLLVALWKTFISDAGQAMSAPQGPALGRLQTHIQSNMREHAEMPRAVGIVLWGTSLRRELPHLSEKDI